VSLIKHGKILKYSVHAAAVNAIMSSGTAGNRHGKDHGENLITGFKIYFLTAI
jgi:hypothetical protein